MVEPPSTIIEEREEFMVSPKGDAQPTFRIAHFLKPSLTSTGKPPVPELPSNFLPSLTTTLESIKQPLKVSFNGWRTKQKNWKTWLDRMHSLHQSTWKKAGIYEAIMGSIYEIRRTDDLVYGIAERWCPDTNTFIFPWGEATITLEDMMVLGGYSVLGDSVLSPLESRELEEIEDKLIEARSQISKTKAQKACQYAWMRYFMDGEKECEHEAFLSLWLTRFVFPRISFVTVVKSVFPVAIHLARGKQLALAPAVLASIYRDLSLFKKAIVASTKVGTTSKDNNDALRLNLYLWSPFQLVQIWAWERFVTLQPKPNSIKNGEPRLARWNKLKKLKVENVRLDLDSAGECFQWRPYSSEVKNWLFPKFYGGKEGWVSIDLGLDRNLVSFARCLRVCELVGLDCIEHYFPHRVAMQFGMDQDIPRHVARNNKTPEIAWRSYRKSIGDEKLYIPSGAFKSDVTARYLAWWKQSFLGQRNSVEGVVWKDKSTKRSKRLPKSYKDKNGDNNAAVPPGFPPKSIMMEEGDSDKEDKLTIFNLLKSSKKHNSVGNKLAADSKPSVGTQSQSPSSFMADDVTSRMMESLTELEDNIFHGKTSLGGPEKDMEDKNESQAGNPINDKESVNNYKGANNSSGTEVLINKLEEVLAGLKAKNSYSQSQDAISPTSSTAAIENIRKRKLSMSREGCSQSQDGDIADKVKRKAGDFAKNDPKGVAKEVKRETGDSVDDPLYIAGINGGIEEGEVFKGSVRGATANGVGRKKVREFLNNPINVDDYKDTKTSKLQKLGHEERLKKIEKLLGLNPE